MSHPLSAGVEPLASAMFLHARSCSLAAEVAYESHSHADHVGHSRRVPLYAPPGANRWHKRGSRGVPEGAPSSSPWIWLPLGSDGSVQMTRGTRGVPNA